MQGHIIDYKIIILYCFQADRNSVFQIACYKSLY